MAHSREPNAYPLSKSSGTGALVQSAPSGQLPASMQDLSCGPWHPGAAVRGGSVSAVRKSVE